MRQNKSMIFKISPLQLKSARVFFYLTMQKAILRQFCSRLCWWQIQDYFSSSNIWGTSPVFMVHFDRDVRWLCSPNIIKNCATQEWLGLMCLIYVNAENKMKVQRGLLCFPLWHCPSHTRDCYKQQQICVKSTKHYILSYFYQ